MGMPVITASTTTRDQAITDLIQSVALEETALSHILNAEGEKIQKVLSLHNCDQKDILEVNKSVEDMVDKITSLEIVLKSKLDLITPLLDDCCKKPSKDDCCKKSPKEEY